MFKVDTRTAAQHRIARYAALVFKTCIVASGFVLAYFILTKGL